LYAEPEARVVDWDGEVFQQRMPKEEPEDIEDVVTVVCEGVGVDDCVEMYCKQTSKDEDDCLQRFRIAGVARLLSDFDFGAGYGRQQVHYTAV
jgi:hypothetical protein